MLEQVELGNKMTKADYLLREPSIRQALLDAQRALQDAKVPVIVVFGGVDGAGKSELLALMNEWMDPRWIKTSAYAKPSDEESERPPYWRYWRDLPARGQIGQFLSAWYSKPLLDHVHGDISDEEFEAELAHVQRFEKMLADDGALILKYWLHLDKKSQKKHLKKLEKDQLTSWRVSKHDWKNWRRYDDFVASTDHLISTTHKDHAQWNLIDGNNERYRSMAVAEHMLSSIQQRLAEKPAEPPAVELPAAPATTVLQRVDTEAVLSREEYRQRLRGAQARLNDLQQQANERGISTLLVFEGWDAAGKGGAVRRVIHAIDPRQYTVVPIAAPTKEELAQHYLWRFWRHIPRAGRVTIFDRSWYGRVLVERVEGFAKDHEWLRSYDEINEFEASLTEHGIVLCKFWLHITSDEQLKRFEDRAATPHKAWKLTDEDWRNRDRWDDYEHAVHDMVERTSPANAPWTLVPANQKWMSRVTVLETVCASLEARLAKKKP